MQTTDDVPDLSGQIEILSYRAVFNGPYSNVYRGRLKTSGQMVAIKVLNPIRGVALHTIRRRIDRERHTWGVLRHPNILPLYGFADDHELFQPFGAFVSPWLHRGDLSQYLHEHGQTATLSERVDLWKGVISGVAYLHGHSPLLIHGDLKPRNILIDEQGSARICDFGLVRVFLEFGDSGMTTTTAHTGTERYLAYELVMGGDDVVPTTSSDIWALGCIGLEVLFLRLPYSYTGAHLRRFMLGEMQAKRPPAYRPSDLNMAQTSLWNMTSSCWDRDPSHRPKAHALLHHPALVNWYDCNLFNELSRQATWGSFPLFEHGDVGASPGQYMEIFPGPAMGSSPGPRMEASPGQHMEVSPGQHMEVSPAPHMEASPEQYMEIWSSSPSYVSSNTPPTAGWRSDAVDSRHSRNRGHRVGESRLIHGSNPLSEGPGRTHQTTSQEASAFYEAPWVDEIFTKAGAPAASGPLTSRPSAQYAQPTHTYRSTQRIAPADRLEDLRNQHGVKGDSFMTQRQQIANTEVGGNRRGTTTGRFEAALSAYSVEPPPSERGLLFPWLGTSRHLWEPHNIENFGLQSHGPSVYSIGTPGANAPDQWVPAGNVLPNRFPEGPSPLSSSRLQATLTAEPVDPHTLQILNQKVTYPQYQQTVAHH